MNDSTKPVSNKTIPYRCITSLKSLTPRMITCLAVHQNLLYAASVTIINVYDLSDYTHHDAFNDNHTSGFVKSIAFSHSNIYTAHQDCKIRIWQVTPSKRHRLLSTLPTVKDRLLRSISPKNYVTVRRHKRSLWIQHSDTVSGLVVNDKLLYSISWDRCFKIWDVSSGNFRCLESVKAHEDAVNAVVVSDDGTVYTASADGCIKVWERDDKLRKHTLVTTLEKHKSTVNALALTGDGRVLFSGGSDRLIMVWERMKDGDHVEFVQELWGHEGVILCLVSHVKGLLASGSADQTVRIWQRGSESGFCCMVVLRGHEKPVKSLVAVPGSDDVSNGVVSLCSGSLDGEIKLWEIYC
ncbi:Transducin/WD40 repeat protein [Quillaja saponaria]|uniref:Transducin/WD40 repeat protein n=1 Tax=Quillaja saponaria TaxID=32244 RepID=A0AAD7PI96_QUISA|nr:Transducin/WD40 repeat protein [Quillaja saponaria]